MEEAVDGRTRTADVGAERAESDQLTGEWRRGEIVRRERSEVARSPNAFERVQERGAPGVPALRAISCIERCVHRRGRGLLRVLRQDEQNPEVLRQVDGRERRAVAGTEPRSVDEKERHIGAELCSD